MNDLPVGRSVDETLRLIKAFQFVEKHGEGTILSESRVSHDELWFYFTVCPANWTPNAPTIKPNPKESKEYFNKVN